MGDLVIFIMVFSLLVWLVSTLYTFFVSSPYKRDNNADFGEIDIEQAKQLLKTKLEYPFCKSICTNEAGNLDLTCKYATYDVKIQDRKLVIENKFRPFAKLGNIEEEKDCLEAYLVKILLPETDVNPPRALGHFRRYIQFRVLKRISGWLFIILLILCTLNEKGINVTDVMNIWKSKGVSQMCFTDYSEEITIGEALQVTCSNGKWSSNKIGDGIYHVTFSGYGANGSLVIILFQTNGSECSIKSITIDGEDITLMKGLFLEALYEGVADESGVGSISGPGVGKAEESISEMNMEELNKNDLEQKRENEDTYIEEDEFDEELYDSEVQGFSNDPIPVWELEGHYEGIIGAQSYLDFSVYTDSSEDGSVGVADIYVEGGQYSYQAEIYEVSTNLYKAEVDTSENVMLSAYKDGDYFILQLYVDGECITEYLLVSQFQS